MCEAIDCATDARVLVVVMSNVALVLTKLMIICKDDRAPEENVALILEDVLLYHILDNIVDLLRIFSFL